MSVPSPSTAMSIRRETAAATESKFLTPEHLDMTLSLVPFTSNSRAIRAEGSETGPHTSRDDRKTGLKRLAQHSATARKRLRLP